MMGDKTADIHTYNSLCNGCTSHCCTEAMSPFALHDELINLRNLVKKPISEIADEISIDNKIFHTLKEKKDSTECLFYDSEKNQCSVYENRPFDCHMFPFDIRKINGKYMWILFTCHGQSESDWSWTENNLSNLEDHVGFDEVVSNIEYFSNNKKIHSYPSNRVLNHSSFVILREVNTRIANKPKEPHCKQSI